MLVPDLYKGKIGVDAEEASHVSRVRQPARTRQSAHQRFARVCTLSTL